MAVNEFGAKLDRNGYAPSIIGDHNEYRCKLCARNGTADHLDRHEIFSGGLREKNAIFHGLGYRDHDEKKIDELAQALYAVIVDNPKMFAEKTTMYTEISVGKSQ